MHKKLIGSTVIGVAALVMVASQLVARTAPVLTALDYAEIQQLYSRYAFGHDTTADDGGMYARTFTEDGVFDFTNPTSDEWVPVEGHEQLKMFAKGFGAGLDAPYHHAMNILIEPTAEGVMGAAYVITVGKAEDGIRVKGTFHDELVRTPDGWRFKKRTFTYGGIGDELLQALAQ